MLDKIQDKCLQVTEFFSRQAGSHRDREIELRAEIAAVLAKGKEVNKAETEAGEEGGPTVTESDIQHIIST